MANHGSQQRKTVSQLQPLAHCNRAPSAPARWSSLDQGHEMIRQGCWKVAMEPTSSKHRKGLFDATEQPLSPLQLQVQHLANDSSVTRTAYTTHTYAATCCLPLPVTNSCCCFTTAPSNQQITMHMRSGICVNKPNRLELWSDNDTATIRIQSFHFVLIKYIFSLWHQKKYCRHIVYSL